MTDTSAPSDAELQALFQQKTYQHIDAKRTSEEKHGFAGRQNAVTGQWEMKVPTRTGNVIYVTILENSASTIFEAVCGNLTPKPGAPVVVRLERGVWVAHADTGEMTTFSPTVGLGTQPHTHRLGQGNEDVVEGLRFEPANPHVAGANSLSVRVEPGWYRYNNTDVKWAGGEINLTANLPSTANMWAWVKIGIDPTTNTLVAKTGTEYAKVYPISATELAPITFDSNDILIVRICGVKLRNGQSRIPDYRDFEDLRMYISGMNAPVSSGGDDAYFLQWAGF